MEFEPSAQSIRTWVRVFTVPVPAEAGEPTVEQTAAGRVVGRRRMGETLDVLCDVRFSVITVVEGNTDVAEDR